MPNAFPPLPNLRQVIQLLPELAQWTYCTHAALDRVLDI